MQSLLHKNQSRLSAFIKVLVLIKFLSLDIITNAQQPIQQINTFRAYNVKDGFAGGLTFSFFQDKSGYLWISTSNGLFRYDGFYFDKLNERDDLNATYFPEIGSYHNNVVISSRNSLIFYDSKNDSFTSIPYPENVEADAMTFIYEFNEAIYIFNLIGAVGPYGRGNFHLVFDPKLKKFTSISDLGPRQVVMNPPCNPQQTIFDYNGNILEMQANGSFRQITKIAGTLKIVTYTGNNSWVAFDDEQHCFIRITYREKNYLKEKIVDWGEQMYQSKNKSIVLRDGSIIFISKGHDLYKLSNKSIKKIFSTDDVLYLISQDDAENYWAGGVKAIYNIYNNNFQEVKLKDSVAQHFDKVLTDKDGKLTLSAYDKGIWQLNEQINGNTERNIASYTQLKKYEEGFTQTGTLLSNNNLVFGTAPGFIFGHDFVWEEINMNYQVLLDIVEKNDSSGIYLATRYGLKEWSQLSGLKQVDAPSDMKNVRIQCFYKDRNKNIWVISNNGAGIIRNGIMIRDTIFSRHKVLKLVQDNNNNYWVSTTKGLFIYSNGKFLEPFPHLFSQGPDNMLITLDSILAMSSKTNLYIVDLKKYYLQDKLACYTYNYNNGLPINDINRNCFTEDSLGRLWINGLSQLFFCYPDRLSNQDISITPKVTSFTSNRQEFLHKEILFNENTGIKLSPGDDKLSFVFSAISILNPGFIFFRYRLHGLTENWSNPTKETVATFYNLKPGNYRFEVSTSFDAANWSVSATTPLVIIRPYWYQTALFKASIIAIIFILLYILHRIKLNHALKLERLRKTISSDLHDEIGSTLSSINIYAGLAKKEANNETYLDSINKNVSEVVNKLDDLVWSINPKYDNTISIINRLRSYAESLAQAREISFEIKNELHESDIKLTAETKHNIYLVAKELINNAIKHSQCKHILLQFSQQQKNLLFKVEDDGKGFDENSIRKDRNGLNNIKQRVAAMKGNINIETLTGKGTKTTISIPI